MDSKLSEMRRRNPKGSMTNLNPSNKQLCDSTYMSSSHDDLRGETASRETVDIKGKRQCRQEHGSRVARGLKGDGENAQLGFEVAL